ncbi:hypothetical protein N0V85_005499 [Neurospora sp. IMI 360204]|nr:hypothetical protein N0V85_005499 [Neurospora sp. IMI 360204]
MSGIEVAGLIIGIIPLLATTIDQCQQGYELLDEWIHFRREFSEFSNTVRCQRLLLKQLIQRTLASVTESKETSARMLENPRCDEWRDPVITEKLKNKLSGDEEYDTFSKLLQSVHRQLEKLISGLPKYSGPKPKKRLKDRVTFMSQQIHSLKELLDNAEIIQTSRQPYTENSIVALFERVRRQATSLHRAITRSWTCGCDSHAFKLIIGRPSRPGHSGKDNPTSEEKVLRIALPCGDGAKGDALTSQSASNADRWCIVEAALATTFEPHVSVWSQLKSAEKSSTQMLLTIPSGDWDKNNIYFSVNQDGSVNTAMPFLISRNNSACTSNTKSKKDTEPAEEPTSHTSRPHDHGKILLALGTLILELWFGQPLESQPSWEANFGPNGQETEFTKFNAAATWQRMIADRGGPELHNITRRCIYGNFGLATQSLEDAELIKAVYENVVVELQRVCDALA